MAKETIVNCKQCKRLFRQLTAKDMCPECSSEYHDQLSKVYQHVLRHERLSLEDIATQCKIPLSQVEAYFYDGKLGTASGHITSKCNRCGMDVLPIQRKGRFCIECANKVETEVKKDSFVREPEEMVEKLELNKTNLKTVNGTAGSGSGNGSDNSPQPQAAKPEAIPNKKAEPLGEKDRPFGIIRR